MAPAEISVRDLVGLPHVPGGKFVDGVLPLGGIDCWGVVLEVRRRAGLWTPDLWDLGEAPVDIHPDGLPAEFTQHVVELDGPQDYCCVDLRSAWPGGHAGCYLPGGLIIETHRHAGVICRPIDRVQRRVRRYLEFTR